MPHIFVLDLRIDVPDSNRAYLYIKMLEDIAKMLQGRLEKPSLANFFKFTSQTSASIDIEPQILVSILENAAIQFDEVAIQYMDKDLERFRDHIIPEATRKRIQESILRRQPNISKDRLNQLVNIEYAKSLSKKQAIEIYNNYFTEEYNGNKHRFANVMLQRYPIMQSQLTILKDNYLRNINQVLTRVNQDSGLIAKCFLRDMTSPVLVRIIQTGSDLHKQGQQVLILVFEEKDNTSQDSVSERKVIYKPSSVTSDVMLFGDVVALAKILPEYKNQRSLVEIFNDLSIKDSDRKRLDTYFILPRQDGNNASLDQYGFIQYLHGVDYSNVDHDKLIEEEIKKAEPREVGSKKFEDSLNEKLRQAELDHEKSGQVTSVSQHTIDSISSELGYLLAIMAMSGITDSHLENLLITFSAAYLIDGEVCLSLLTTASPKDTSALDLATGSMNTSSLTKEEYVVLVDGSGKKEVLVDLPAKNKMFLATTGNHQRAQLANLNSEKVITAYIDAINQMARNANGILAWYNQPQVKNMYVRFLPKSTAFFKGLLRQWKLGQLTKEKLESICKLEINKGLKDYADAVHEYNRPDFNPESPPHWDMSKFLVPLNDPRYESKYMDFIIQWCIDNAGIKDEHFRISKLPPYDQLLKSLPPYPIPAAVVFANPQNLEHEFENNSVPVFYIRADDTELYDSRGNKVAVPADFRAMQDTIKDKPVDAMPAFLPISPLEITKRRAEKILTNQPMRELMYKVAKSQLHELAIISVAEFHEYQRKILDYERSLEKDDWKIREFSHLLNTLRDKLKQYESHLHNNNYIGYRHSSYEKETYCIIKDINSITELMNKHADFIQDNPSLYDEMLSLNQVTKRSLEKYASVMQDEANSLLFTDPEWFVFYEFMQHFNYSAHDPTVQVFYSIDLKDLKEIHELKLEYELLLQRPAHSLQDELILLNRLNNVFELYRSGMLGDEFIRMRVDGFKEKCIARAKYVAAELEANKEQIARPQKP